MAQRLTLLYPAWAGAQEAKLSELSGPKFMRRDEFKNYANELRIKTKQYKEMKQELAALRAETVVLQRTEQILRSRDSNLKEYLEQLEAKRGVSGYTETQACARARTGGAAVRLS